MEDVIWNLDLNSWKNKTTLENVSWRLKFGIFLTSVFC